MTLYGQVQRRWVEPDGQFVFVYLDKDGVERTKTVTEAEYNDHPEAPEVEPEED